MRRHLHLIAAVGVVALALAGTGLIVSARSPVDRQPSEVPAPLVRVIEVARRDQQHTVTSQGTVRPLVESVLVAQVGGRIVSVAPSFADGGFFAAGERLIEIDRRDYELAVSQAEARLAQARVRLDLERAEAQIARDDWADLGEGEPSPLTLREPQLAEAQAGLEGALAALEQARLQLERTRVTAPFPGRVREKRVDLGQFVAPGTPLAEIYSIEAAEVRLPVTKEDLAFLDVELGLPSGRRGPAVRLSGMLAGERREWPGRIVRTGSELDPRTRMLPLYARVDDPFARAAGADHSPLPMGLFVDAVIAGLPAEGVVELPRGALRDGDRVLVVDSESRLRFRPVSILRRVDDVALVSAGLDGGERVCISPLETVTDGMLVRTQLEEPAASVESAP